MLPFAEPATPDDSPRGWAESIAAYLTRSTMAVACESRAWLSRHILLSRESTRPDLVQRLRAEDDRQHLSACWELGLLGFLVGHGFHLEPHPSVAGTPRRPDWLVTSESGVRFYLEATTASPSDEEFAADRRRGQLLDALNKVASPDHFLHVRVDAEGTGTPAGRRFRAQTMRALGDWSHEELAGLELDGMPEATLVDEGWAANLSPIPKDPDARGKPGARAVGVIGPEPLLDPIEPARAALEAKAHAYGDLDAPFVIAVNVLSPMTDDQVVSAMLFGSPAVAFATDGSRRTRNFRRPDGFWWKGRPTNTRVAAVVIGVDFAGATTDITAISAWPNPYAVAPLDLASFPFARLIVDADGATLRRL